MKLRLGCDGSEHSMQFLSEFGEFMRSLHDKSSRSVTLSKGTCIAFHHTSRGLVGLTRFLLEQHSNVLNYVLLGKVQSDKIEGHFGHLRKFVGGNYWASNVNLWKTKR